MAKEFRERREGEKVADYRVAKQRWKNRQEAKAQESNQTDNNNQSSSTKPENQSSAPVPKPEREKGQDKQEYRGEVKDWRKEKRMAGDKIKDEVKSGNKNPLNPVDTSKGPRGPVAPGKSQPGTGFVKPENVAGVPQGGGPTGPTAPSSPALALLQALRRIC